MNITLTFHDGREATAALPFVGAGHVVVEGHQCECSRDQTLIVSGFVGKQREEDGGARVVSEAGCSRCKGSVGTLTVTISTLFGREEDERVLNGRCRVY